MQSQLQTEEDALNTASQQRVYLETLANIPLAARFFEDAEWQHPWDCLRSTQELEKLRAQLADLARITPTAIPMFVRSKSRSRKTEKMKEQIVWPA